LEYIIGILDLTLQWFDFSLELTLPFES